MPTGMETKGHSGYQLNINFTNGFGMHINFGVEIIYLGCGYPSIGTFAMNLLKTCMFH